MKENELIEKQGSKKQKIAIIAGSLGLFLTLLGVAAWIGTRNRPQAKLVSPLVKMAQNQPTETKKTLSYYIITSQEFLNKARNLANNNQNQTPEDKKEILDQVEQALAIINEAISLYPQEDQAFAQRAKIYDSLSPFLKEATQLAVRDLNEAISINRKNPDYYRQLALLHQGDGNFEAAAAAYFNAYRLSMNDNQTLYNLASALEKSGQIDKAVYYYEKLLALLPNKDPSLTVIQKRKSHLEKLLANSHLEYLSEPGMEMVPKKPIKDNPVLGIEELPLKQALAADQLIIASPEERESQSLEAGETETNAKTGEAVLPAGETETTIYNQYVAQDKQIIIVPNNDTQNQILYLSAKKANGPNEKGWFKVAIDKPLDQEIEFSWWIVD